MPIQINTLEIENIKRVKAVSLDCSGQALTVIGGKNGQGKTSCLDAIAYALGGERFRPSNAKRDDSVVPPAITITLSNGVVVERKGKKSALKVTDPAGGRGGQQLLNAFVHQFALNLPKFLGASDVEKAKVLLQVIGVEDDLERLGREESKIYLTRLAVGQEADRKRKFADEMRWYVDAPPVMISVAKLLSDHKKALAHEELVKKLGDEQDRLRKEFDELKGKIEENKSRAIEITNELASIRTENRPDSAALVTRINQAEEINVQVRANLDKEKAIEDATDHERRRDELTTKLGKVRAEKTALFRGASFPLAGLSVIDGCLAYEGKVWDCMSGSDQLRVATAIVRKLNPQCGFVLLDKLEQMDLDSLREFGEWLEAEGLQVIATRVSTGDECSIIIEDGTVVAQTQPQFTAGSF